MELGCLLAGALVRTNDLPLKRWDIHGLL